jgi:hypothetical protein
MLKKSVTPFMCRLARCMAGRSGANGVKLLGVYVVEKGKPLASPAPQQ